MTSDFVNVGAEVQQSLSRIKASGGPSKSSDRLQLVDAQSASLISGLRTRGRKSLEDSDSVRLVYRNGLKVCVQEHHKDGIPLLTNVDSAQPLTRFAARLEAAAFDLQSAGDAIRSFNSICTLDSARLSVRGLVVWQLRILQLLR